MQLCSELFALFVFGDSDSGSEEEFLAKKKPQNGKARRGRLRKTYVVSESEVESDDEDEDKCPISSMFKTKSSTVENTTQEVEEKVDNGAVDTSNKKAVDDVAAESIRHADDIGVDGQLKRYFFCLIDNQGSFTFVTKGTGCSYLKIYCKEHLVC